MSYILEALKKSEQERQLGAVPRPEAALVSAATPSRRLWPWLLSAVLLVNAGLLLWLVLKPTATPPPAVSAAVPPADAMSDGAPAPSARTQERAAPPPADPPPAGDRQPPPAPQPVPAPVAKAAPTAPARGSVQWLPDPAAESQVAVDAPPPAPPPAPHWEELSAAERNGLTRPRLDVHVYAETAAQRFVLINLKRYREGERLDTGGRLAAITPAGVIIEAGGIRYRVERP